MKFMLLFFILIATAITVYADSHDASNNYLPKISRATNLNVKSSCYHSFLNTTKFPYLEDTSIFAHKNSLINSLDSVLFNLSTATMNGIYIEFPVSVRSDENIFAVDFSFKYNYLNVEFDSIINMTSGLQYQYYLNPDDSTLRFTSNRLVTIPNDSAVVILKFKTFNGQMCANDIDSVLTYLNGDDCSYSLTGCIVTGIQEVNKPDIPIVVYPNPASVEFSFELPGLLNIEIIIIIDAAGKIENIITNPGLSKINIESMNPGLYFIEFVNITDNYFQRVKLIKTESN